MCRKMAESFQTIRNHPEESIRIIPSEMDPTGLVDSIIKILWKAGNRITARQYGDILLNQFHAAYLKRYSKSSKSQEVEQRSQGKDIGSVPSNQ